MGLRSGYTRTAIGVFPDDWRPTRIRKYSAFVTKGATPTTYGFHWQDDGVVFLRSECVSDHGLDLAQAMFISSKAHAALVRGEVRSGDILMTITGYVGRVIQLPRDFGYGNINQHIARIRVNDPDVCPEFVYHYLSQPSIRAYYASITTGQAYPQISLVQVRETQVPLPLPSEQRAIAGALGDVDALLHALTQLIDKKRDLKQAIMQQLLTGWTRLPGFSGEWETTSFGNVFSKINAKENQIQTSEYRVTGVIPVVDQGKEPVVGFSDREDKRFRCPQGGVIIFGDHTCIVKFVNFDFVVGADGTQILATKSGRCARFHAFQLQLRGIPTTGYNRHFKFLKERLFVAPPLPEQTAIAAVLADMDAEIAALEQRLAKIRLMKQGMMQELLTGRTRLA